MILYGDFVKFWWNPQTKLAVLPTDAVLGSHVLVDGWVARVPDARYTNSVLLLLNEGPAPDGLKMRRASMTDIQNWKVPNFTLDKYCIWLDCGYIIKDKDYSFFQVGDSIEVANFRDHFISFNSVYMKSASIQTKTIIGIHPELTQWFPYYAFEDEIEGHLQVSARESDIWQFPPKYLGKRFSFVSHSKVRAVDKRQAQGMNCMNRYCNERFPWAEGPNCPNDVFLCYSCRTNPVTYSLVMSAIERTHP